MMNFAPVPKRVVLYGRVSTEHKEQISALENQMDWYKQYLAFHPEWTLVGEYVDEGITGTSAEKRPQFMQMIEDAKKKKFDLILTREVSRFARNTVDTLQYTRKLKAYGVEVFFINDNIKTMDCDGELRLTIMATLAQDESRKTSVRVKAGQQTSMDKGVIYGNGNILGYKRVTKLIGENKTEVEWHIDPEQAKTVRFIYDQYLAGRGLTQIKKDLEDLGIKTAMGKSNWFPTVISHVLKNSFYCGIITYHKEYTPDFLTQKKIKNYGEMELTQVRGTHKTIVTEEEYERVQLIMESKRKECKNLNQGRSAGGKRPRTTVWGKLLECECGCKFSLRPWGREPNGERRHGYQCYSSVGTGSYESRKKRGLPLEGICRSPMVPEWKLQMMANHIFRNYLLEKEKVLNLANSILEAHIADTGPKEDKTEVIAWKTDELQKLQRKRSRLIDMLSDGDIDQAAFREKTAEVDKKIGTLTEELRELQLEQEPAPVIADYAEKLEVLQYALAQYTNWDGQDVPPNVIEAFVVKIVVHPDGFDWYLRFNGDPKDPLKCTVEGKRQKSAKIGTLGSNLPTLCDGDTGRYSRSTVISGFSAPPNIARCPGSL